MGIFVILVGYKRNFKLEMWVFLRDSVHYSYDDALGFQEEWDLCDGSFYWQ